jgi:hypothetical protein
MMEWNPGEALKNNVLATRSFGELAVEHGVEQRLLEQRGFPDFEKWCKIQPQK